MGDILKQFYDQLEAKRKEPRQAEDKRKELQAEKEDAVCAVHEAAENLKKHDRKIASIRSKIKTFKATLNL